MSTELCSTWPVFGNRWSASNRVWPNSAPNHKRLTPCVSMLVPAVYANSVDLVGQLRDGLHQARGGIDQIWSGFARMRSGSLPNLVVFSTNFGARGQFGSISTQFRVGLHQLWAVMEVHLKRLRGGSIARRCNRHSGDAFQLHAFRNDDEDTHTVPQISYIWARIDQAWPDFDRHRPNFSHQTRPLTGRKMAATSENGVSRNLGLGRAAPPRAQATACGEPELSWARRCSQARGHSPRGPWGRACAGGRSRDTRRSALEDVVASGGVRDGGRRTPASVHGCRRARFPDRSGRHSTPLLRNAARAQLRAPRRSHSPTPRRGARARLAPPPPHGLRPCLQSCHSRNPTACGPVRGSRRSA